MLDRKVVVTRSAMQSLGLACVLVFGVSGCRHKPVVPPLPPITQPVDLVEVPRQEPPPMIQPPHITLPPVPVASGAHPHRERRRRTATANASTPETEPSSTSSPETAAIGSLSLGGVANPHAQQEAADLITSIEKRLNGLSAQKAEGEKQQVSRIRNFEKQAQDALNSGDVEGAKTLATKARLLLDDLEK
ncbi:hypothetical protein [Edaphobacter albus]|uniref:hypothetical protein n=1 Tax=Edaphobacter sp. 4G125 TaxID=2763071 RepID=UPI001647717B|nr:hypothetical protein [Edaphobacter sp. 4G125]QNI38151.1 hypothetical protein H7846_07860 [Edaphobacter sp. 4G125]